MKKYFLFIFLIFLSYFEISKEETSPCEKIVPSTVEDCLGKETEDEKEYEWHCCYESKKSNGVVSNQCSLLSKESYNNIKDYVGVLKDQKYEDIDIKCKSFYLQISLLLLILYVL